jgi:hypothetical protein
MLRELLQQLIPDRTIDDPLQVWVVREHEGQVEYIELRDERPHGPDADARNRQGADLRLLDHFFLAAELHGRIHLHAQAPGRGLAELLAHADDRLDGGITERMHVRRFQHHPLLRERGACLRCKRERGGCTEPQKRAAFHGVLLARFARLLSFRSVRERHCPRAAAHACSSYHAGRTIALCGAMPSVNQ